MHATEDIDSASYIYLLNACTELQTLEFGLTDHKLLNMLPYIQPNKLKVVKVESSDEFLMESVVELTKYTPALEALSVTSCFDRGESDPRIPCSLNPLPVRPYPFALFPCSPFHQSSANLCHACLSHL